jgi:hypothetical protein
LGRVEGGDGSGVVFFVVFFFIVVIFVFFIFFIFFIFVIFFVFVFAVEFFVGGDFVGGAGLGEVDGGRFDGFGRAEDVADSLRGGRFEVEMRAVGGRELQAVEEGGGALDFEGSGGESVDDEREGELDGLLVFEREELDVLAGDEIALGDAVEAIAGVALVHAGVEVAELGAGEGDGFALKAVGFDVTADIDGIHGFASFGRHPLPPWGGGG